MLTELAQYLNFDAGTNWRDSADIDWTLTRYEANADEKLFINETGSDAWRPDCASDALSNMYIAGDFANNHVGMTVVESAVTSGLYAARVLVRRRGVGDPVEIIRPDVAIARDMLYVWLRYAWAPYVCAASAWSTATGWLERAASLGRAASGAARRGSGLRWVTTPAAAKARQRRES